MCNEAKSPEVTFTPEQVREIRRRIEALSKYAAYAPGNLRVNPCGNALLADSVLAAFPLPKVTRYRTFTRCGDVYRVCGKTVECRDGKRWVPSGYGSGQISEFAEHMARFGDWAALTAFADICARPTEEIDG